MNPRFSLGQIVATPAALAIGVDLLPYLRRHHCGDWGDELGEEDKELNEKALEYDSRILSRYSTPGGSIYIITEADRSSACILLPEEY